MSIKVKRFILGLALGCALMFFTASLAGAQEITPAPEAAPAPEIDPEDYSDDLSFIEHAVAGVTDKFPFDIVGDVPASPEGCPELSMYGSTLSLCFLKSAIGFFKYPVSIGVVLYIFDWI